MVLHVSSSLCVLGSRNSSAARMRSRTASSRNCLSSSAAMSGWCSDRTICKELQCEKNSRSCFEGVERGRVIDVRRERGERVALSVRVHALIDSWHFCSASPSPQCKQPFAAVVRENPSLLRSRVDRAHFNYITYLHQQHRANRSADTVPMHLTPRYALQTSSVSVHFCDTQHPLRLK